MTRKRIVLPTLESHWIGQCDFTVPPGTGPKTNPPAHQIFPLQQIVLGKTHVIHWDSLWEITQYKQYDGFIFISHPHILLLACKHWLVNVQTWSKSGFVLFIKLSIKSVILSQLTAKIHALINSKAFMATNLRLCLPFDISVVILFLLMGNLPILLYLLPYDQFTEPVSNQVYHVIAISSKAHLRST